MAEFLMPHLGADMTAGTLLAWRKKPGDKVERGEIIADVETDKANIEVEIFISGILEKVLVEPGIKVPVGTPLAVIRVPGETTQKEVPSGVMPAPLVAPAVPAQVSAAPNREGERLRISPAAKKLAQDLGIDPASVMASSPSGRISLEDIRAAAQKVATAPASSSADRRARMRAVIAAAMARSKREIPHYYLSTTIDMRRALDWLEQENQRRPVEQRLLYGVLLIRAVALALREVPELNALWEADQAVTKTSIHVGVAISLREGGLIAPALHETDQRPLGELMASLRDLVQRARAGGLKSSELSEATITVTNLGEQGVDSVFGIIYPPQVALVGFGRIAERPWCRDGQIVAAPLLEISLSGDHRVTDGHRGGVFLKAVDRLLQEPEKL